VTLAKLVHCLAFEQTGGGVRAWLDRHTSPRLQKRTAAKIEGAWRQLDVALGRSLAAEFGLIAPGTNLPFAAEPAAAAEGFVALPNPSRFEA